MRLPLVSVIILAGSACALRPGMNSTCAWPADGTPSSETRHLVADVRIAEELAIRYADAAGKLDPEWRNRLDSCTDRLFATISATHRVPVEAVTSARGRLSEPRFDPVALLPMVALFVAAAWTIGGWLANRFSGDEPSVRVVASSIVSLATGGVVAMLGSLGAAIVWMIQMGSTHGSYRALRPTWMGRIR